MKDLFVLSQRIGHLGRNLDESVENLVWGLRAIHRGDFASAWWFLSMGGFCPDGSAEAHAQWLAEESEVPEVEAIGRQPSLFSPDVTARNGGGR